MIYRGMNIEVRDGKWFWCDPKLNPITSQRTPPSPVYGPFETDEEVFTNIDRHKKEQARSK